MTRPRRRGSRIPPLRIIGQCRLLVLRWGLTFLTVTPFFALDVAKSAPFSKEPLNLWVTSDIAQSCGPANAWRAVQGDVELKLNAAGIAVSRVHTAELRVDLNCSPVLGSRGTTDMGVCLGLSETRGTARATTWQKCESYRCSGPECEAVVHSGLTSLVDWFVLSREINSKYELPQPSVRTAGAAREPYRERGQASIAAGLSDYASGPKLVMDLRVLYYLTYLLVCLAVLSRWRWSKASR